MNVTELESESEIRNSIVQDKPIFASINYTLEHISFFLEFPVKHINFHAISSRFQIETSPVLIGDSKAILHTAFIAFM